MAEGPIEPENGEECVPCKDPPGYIRDKVCAAIAPGDVEACVADFLPVLEQRLRHEIDSENMKQRFRELFDKYQARPAEIPATTTTTTTETEPEPAPEGPALLPRMRILEALNMRLASRLG